MHGDVAKKKLGGIQGTSFNQGVFGRTPGSLVALLVSPSGRRRPYNKAKSLNMSAGSHMPRA